MFYYSKKSRERIIHSGMCGHIANCDIRDIGYFETLTEAYEQGYRLCRSCSILSKQYKCEEEKLYSYCMGNAMTFYKTDRYINIVTPYSKWRVSITNSGNGLCLYHKNEYKKKNETPSMIDGYHHQKFEAKSIVGCMEYITEHDYFRMTNPLVIKNSKKKAPAIKGTKRYRKEAKRAEKKARKKAIYNVLTIIDSFAVNASQPCA